MLLITINNARITQNIVEFRVVHLAIKQRNVLIIIGERNKITMFEGTSSGLHTHGRLLSSLVDTIVALTAIYSDTLTGVFVSNK
jgi:hypothetical protein